MKYWTAIALISIVSAAQAVAPASWTQASETDFAGGEFKSAVISSRGKVSLSQEVSILMPTAMAGQVISAVATDGKAMYAGAGDSGSVFRIDGAKARKLATVPGAIVTSLTWTGKELLAGSGGDGAGLYAIDAGGKVKARWTDPNVKYVWAVLAGPEGSVYVGTGPQAAIYSVPADGKAQLLFKDGKWAKNVLCLAAANGFLYAGTDENALVIEINLDSKASRVILDADEKEISALTIDDHGGLFAATSDTDKASPEGEDQAGGPAERGKIVAPRPASQPAPKAPRGDDDSTGSPAPDKAAKTPASAPSPAPAAKPRAAAPRAATAARIRAALARLRTKAPQPSETEGPGNAVYHIMPDGLVRTIFRRPVTILAMIRRDGRLILATGNGGTVYSVAPDGDDVVQLANTDAKQVTCIAAAGDGRIVFGTANRGSVAALGGKLAKEGTYTSKAQDAQQISKWGTARIRATTQPGTKVAFSTRSGNLSEVDDKTWSQWSNPVAVGDEFIPISSPAGRFLQYRLTFTAAGQAPPSVGSVEILYQTGNLPPSVSNIEVKPSSTGRDGGEGPGQEGNSPQPFRAVTFTATDSNNDRMVYKIDFRPASADQWIEIADKLESPNYAWDTRTVGDGTYELRITASDRPSNPPASALKAEKVSSPVLVDNTAPVVRHIQAKPAGSNVTCVGSAADSGSRVASLHYAVDSQSDWVSLLPDDGICDSAEESFSFKLSKLKPGPHRVAVKVEDLFGNVGYTAVTVTIPRPQSQPATAPTSKP